MANEKNKIKELVSDDEDPTAELEVISFDDEPDASAEVDRESEAHTFGLGDDGSSQDQGLSISELRSDLKSRKKTISRLQFDIEQLRSKWTGLETEIKARETIVIDLQENIEDLQKTVGRKEKLLRSRDATIRSLKAEIRQRDEAHRALGDEHASLEQQLREQQARADDALQAKSRELEELQEQLVEDSRQSPADPSGTDRREIHDVRGQLSRTERYADDLRIKLNDLAESHEVTRRDRDQVARRLSRNKQRFRDVSAELAATNEQVTELREEIEALGQAHEEEIRILRFELGEAQNTVTETSDLNSQLASDLMDTRNYKEELERLLRDTEQSSQLRIEELERNLGKLAESAEDYAEKLESKSAAINVLLSELAKKSEQIEAIGKIEHVIQDIDDRMSERFDDTDDEADFDEPSDTGSRPVLRDRDKVTRVLIGSIGEQVLRFPLFKDRLTIGRTADNDIQLKLSYISRRHAVVMTDGDKTRVIDWGSKNGVYVNSKRIKEHFLTNGDIVAVGNAKFRYEERRKRDV